MLFDVKLSVLNSQWQIKVAGCSGKAIAVLLSLPKRTYIIVIRSLVVQWAWGPVLNLADSSFFPHILDVFLQQVQAVLAFLSSILLFNSLVVRGPKSI